MFKWFGRFGGSTLSDESTLAIDLYNQKPESGLPSSAAIAESTAETPVRKPFPKWLKRSNENTLFIDLENQKEMPGSPNPPTIVEPTADTHVGKLFPTQESVFRRGSQKPFRTLKHDGTAQGYAGLAEQIQLLATLPPHKNETAAERLKMRWNELKIMARAIEDKTFTANTRVPSAQDTEALYALDRLLTLNKGSKPEQVNYRVTTFLKSAKADAKETQPALKREPKPTLPAWLTNLLHQEHQAPAQPSLYQELVAIADSGAAPEQKLAQYEQLVGECRQAMAPKEAPKKPTRAPVTESGLYGEIDSVLQNRKLGSAEKITALKALEQQYDHFNMAPTSESTLVRNLNRKAHSMLRSLLASHPSSHADLRIKGMQAAFEPLHAEAALACQTVQAEQATKNESANELSPDSANPDQPAANAPEPRLFRDRFVPKGAKGGLTDMIVGRYLVPEESGQVR